jgi:hypothetical protein
VKSAALSWLLVVAAVAIIVQDALRPDVTEHAWESDAAALMILVAFLINRYAKV